MEKTKYAICNVCKKEMALGNGCTIEYIKLGNYFYPRIPYGLERRADFSGDYCHDCNVKMGQIHHLGCDVEECPACHGQLLGYCTCQDEGEE